MKKIGFLSFGHWANYSSYKVRTASDTLLQSIDLSVAAEEIGLDSANFRVHHFAAQLASPFPLLSAIGVKTKNIEIGTGVIDMRYENPLYMVEDAGAADLISGGRLQLGISRGSPEQAIDGWRYFGYELKENESAIDMGRCKALEFLEKVEGKGFAQPKPNSMFQNPGGLLRLEPYSEGLRDRIWWGAGTNATAIWAAEHGMNLQLSTLKVNEGGQPLHVQQAETIRQYKEAWKKAGHKRDPRVSVSRSIFALMNSKDIEYFGRDINSSDQIGGLGEGKNAIYGRSYVAEPDLLIKQLAQDTAIMEADTLLLTIPSTLGVDYNIHILSSILKYIAPELGWK